MCAIPPTLLSSDVLLLLCETISLSQFCTIGFNDELNCSGLGRGGWRSRRRQDERRHAGHHQTLGTNGSGAARQGVHVIKLFFIRHLHSGKERLSLKKLSRLV